MAENTCPKEGAHESRLQKLESQVESMQNEFHEFDKRSEVTFTKVTAALENLADLPNAMNEMTTTMVSMKDSIHDNGVKTEELASTVNSLSSKVAEMDARDRISILEFFKKNWPTVVLLVVIGGLLVTNIVSQYLK